jgi:cell division GTPase FtsZ
MRIIAIGIGGAGCRIVNSLYATDRKSSKVACVQALAVDVDEETIQQLTGLPDNARMCFSALDPGIPSVLGTERQTAPIDINEIVSHVQNMESGENDAIIFCCGLGGSMVDVAPHIIAGLRSSIVEPIFGLVTLPCLAEGERTSAKAADDIEMLSPLLDGIIIFDNETWYKKIKAQKSHLPEKEMGFAEKLGLKKSEKPLPAAQATHHNLNEAIVRRISLILRAGEFKADGGIDLAEVVLDSGEVLNTMKVMGFITIGYAVEKLPHDPLRFLSWLRPAGLFEEDQKKKASRIVELAKQAIYHEISTPCDLTSAHKALVLVAGPSHELSMKGFMTVRKWIDRSIAGLETRSGDYPVMNTKNVAIIVMLSGLENIPRITELKEIRSQSKPKTQADPEGSTRGLWEQNETDIRDDMITLPSRSGRADDTGRRIPARGAPQRSEAFVPAQEPVLSQNVGPVKAGERAYDTRIGRSPPTQPRRAEPVARPGTEEESSTIAETQATPRRRVVVARAERAHSQRPSLHIPSAHESLKRSHKTEISDHAPPEIPFRRPAEDTPRPKETERQRIEKELRRQRAAVMGGHPQKIPPLAERSPPAAPETHIIKPGSRKDSAVPENQTLVKGGEPAVVSEEKRRVIIGKRKITVVSQKEPDLSDAPVSDNAEPAQERTGTANPADSSSGTEDDGMSIEIRDRVFRARDKVFEGKGVWKPPVPTARDSTLLHTELRPKKRASEREDTDSGDTLAGQPVKDTISAKKRTKSEGKDQDLSWI